MPKNEIMSESDGKDESGTPYDSTITVPIVVICDEYTASSGEIFTSAVRDFRDMGLLNATIVGTNTYAKGIMQNTYAYADGSSVTFTVAYYNPPSGVNYHEIGVKPDVHVELPEPKKNPETGQLYIDEDTQYNAAVIELKKLINAN
jgi:carboxyl-terminal processing protease